jgi:hypothetical protein
LSSRYQCKRIERKPPTIKHGLDESYRSTK